MRAHHLDAIVMLQCTLYVSIFVFSCLIFTQDIWVKNLFFQKFHLNILCISLILFFKYSILVFCSQSHFQLGSRIGRKCLKRLESKTYHPTSFAIGHPWRRRIGQSNQGDHCWWWCYSTHPQITHRQEGWSRITKLIIMTPIQTSRKA